MSLTLGNSITGTTSREVDTANNKLFDLGNSLTSSNNKNISIVDGYLGSSLSDSEMLLSAISKSTSYAKNIVAVTEQYLESIASLLQKGMTAIATVNTLSKEKVAVLQKYVDDIRAQLDQIIKTAQFDGKSLLGGQAQNIDVQIGLNITDKLNISVRNISGSNLFRTSINKALNQWIADDPTAGRSSRYANATELATALKNNENLIFASVDGTIPTAGTGALMDPVEIGNVIKAVRDLYPKLFDEIHKTLPLLEEELNNNGKSIRAATEAELGNALAVFGPQIEFFSFLNQTDTKIDTQSNRLIALDVFTSALNEIRAEQASLNNQKQNLLEAIDALRATTNITQKTANSYLKTDHVMTAQEYSELIRTLTASISALQAANKIPEAAQRLINMLAI